MNKFIPPVILTLVFTAILLVVLDTGALLPAAASSEAQIVDALFQFEFQIIAIVFALCMAFLFYSLFRFRRKAGEEGDGEHFEGNITLEAVWTLAPLALVLALGFFTTGKHYDLLEAEPNESMIQVIASQWSWSFIYPQGTITQNELWLLLDEPVRMEITAPPTNVIHSFYIPEFRLKQDAVPGMTTILRFTPNEIGKYNVLCAELCGADLNPGATVDEDGNSKPNTSHATMLADVCVVAQADYDAWLVNGSDSSPDAESCTVAAATEEAVDTMATEEAVDTTATEEAVDTTATEEATDTTSTEDNVGDVITGDATAGQTTALMNGCTACHATVADSPIAVGPSWVGIYEEEVTLADGSVAVIDVEYIRESILNPNAKVVEGFAQGVMPQTFADTLSQDDINNLIAYIVSLSE
jgi:cytochrome c oxidase subunit 2